MQHTPCTCQGNITSPNCCQSPLPLPSCRGNHVLTQVRNQYWVIDDPKQVQNSDKECKVCERRRAQPAVQIMAPLARWKTWKERLQNSVLITLGPLQPRLHKDYLLKKISVPFYLLSKQSGTDFLNASSEMVATRGPEEDRTKSQVIMRQTL